MGAPTTVRWSHLADPDAAKAWQSLPASSRWDTAFGKASFLQAIAEASGWEIHQVTVSDEIGVAAAARIATRSRFGVSMSIVPPLTAYSAIRMRDDPSESTIHDRSSLLEPLLDAIERRFHAAALHLPSAIQDLRTFTWRGWSVRPLYTYRIKLEGMQNPVEHWSESARRIARRQSSDYVIVEAQPDDQAGLVVDGYRRNDRKPPLDRSELAEVVRALEQAGSVKTHAARNQGSGEIEASVAVLSDDHTAYYWLAGGKPGPAMTILLASLLPELASSGVKLFDFVGANTASIAEFKRRFGGQLTTYFRASWRRGLAGRILGAR